MQPKHRQEAELIIDLLDDIATRAERRVNVGKADATAELLTELLRFGVTVARKGLAEGAFD